MAGYNISGYEIANLSERAVMVDEIKSQYPSYTDDQILAEAILKAREIGKTAKILWDGQDIHFSGSVTHECKGFGGIDFNGSKIYMPNYDDGVILQIVPDVTSDITVSAGVILKDHTTDNRLKNKIFQLRGNEDMSLGTRTTTPLNPTNILHWSPTVITDPNGRYKTGELYLVPESGDITCNNVHEFPVITFELCNATIVSYSGTAMSLFASCTRSNTKIHGFTLEGISTKTVFRKGIFYCEGCCNIEVFNLYGANPTQFDLSSGYVCGFKSVTSLHVHDVYLGDRTRWGSIGCHYLHNSVFERCYLNRWDCHFAQTGFNVVRDSVLGAVAYGVGCGEIIIENCIIKNDTENLPRISIRADCVGVFNGSIIIKNCMIYVEDGEYTMVWDDRCWKEKPSNSVLTDAPLAKRIMENCQIFGEYDNLFVTGTTYENDKPLFADLNVVIKCMDINAEDSVVYAPSLLSIKKVLFDGVSMDGNTLKNLVCDLMVANSTVESIVTNSTIPKLIVTGCSFSETQSITNFTKYALSGNIASDMEAVNRHS